MLLSLLFGCKKNTLPPSSKAEQYVKKHLDSKYEQNFEILSIEKMNVGHKFAKYIYSGTACVSGQSESVFEFTVKDKKTINDNYPKVLFSERINFEIEDLFSKYGVSVSGFEVDYVQKSETYLEYEEYRLNQNTVIKCEVENDIGGDLEMGEKLYALAVEAKEKGFCFYIGVNIFGNMRYLMHVDDISLQSEEDWMNRIRTK